MTMLEIFRFISISTLDPASRSVDDTAEPQKRPGPSGETA
jgi:hypothetical protein